MFTRIMLKILQIYTKVHTKYKDESGDFRESFFRDMVPKNNDALGSRNADNNNQKQNLHFWILEA
jgi:hypothetical protein